ncbi:MAG TPA: NAD(P)H-binding protein [Gammaproteobacteria bacterium]|nr:NAD(P)H-binding protein [Gammaproteobacteria bacterium]
MKVILFGATGMVGQGVLQECLRDPRVEAVLAVGRSATGQNHPKLAEWVQRDLFDYSSSAARLKGYDACFFCLGVSSAGMVEADYRRLTHDLTLAAAGTLARLNPAMTFIYVSGAGTDSSERGRVMWARVKGATENALLRLPFKAAYMFRPGIIRPLHGIKSKTGFYNAFYIALGPLLWLLGRWVPGFVTTTEQMGRAMINAACDGAPKPLLESRDINRL